VNAERALPFAEQQVDPVLGQVRDVDPTFAFPDEYRGTWTLPLTFGKRDHALYFGNQRLFRTTNGGETWTLISPDLTRPDPGVPPNLDPATVKDAGVKSPRKGVIYDVGTSPISDGLIWIGTDDGLIWRTVDAGANWTNVTPSQLQPWSKVGIIEPSHSDPNVAYAAIDRHRLEDQRPHILRTRDGGRTWTEITNGLPTSGGPNSVNVIREDPVRPGLLFAGTERSLYVSFDDGDNWQGLNSGLPATSVRDITIHGDDLVIATHGRGFYVLDDIVPIRALAANAQPGIHLYPQSASYRVNEPGFTGTPMPKDEPLAANPPFGAIIDYALPANFTDPVEIAIRDQSGGVVNRFSSNDVPKRLDLSKLPVAPEWAAPKEPPAATPGHHRFVWDLRYAKPAGFGEERVNGVWAPPGHYIVELTAGGQVLRQTLTVLADPRVKVSQQDFDAQFRLAKEIEQQRLRVRAMLKEASDMKAGMAKLDRQADGAALNSQYVSLVGPSPAMQGINSPDTLNGISSWLDKLAAAEDGGDGAPTQDAQRGFAQVSAALGAIEPRWRAFAASVRPRIVSGQ